MVILKKRGWEIPESQAAPEHVFMSRRSLIRGAATIAAAAALPGAARAELDPTAALYPAKKNEKYVLDRALTPEARSSNYNNFYEFGFDKAIASRAQALKLRPWTVKFDGMVEKEKTVGIDDLIAAMPIEERLYRMRCVEAWSMAVPWSGFPMAKLVEFAKPLSGAKYVRMETFLDTTVAPMQKQFWYPWPYVEGVTIEEAMNEMAFMVTGVYGKPLAEAIRRADPPGAAVEIRLQGDQVDRARELHRPAAEELLGSGAGLRVRLLGQRQSGGLASALEPGLRGGHRHRPAPPDATVQRLRRIRRRSLQGSAKRAALYVTAQRRP